MQGILPCGRSAVLAGAGDALLPKGRIVSTANGFLAMRGGWADGKGGRKAIMPLARGPDGQS